MMNAFTYFIHKISTCFYASFPYNIDFKIEKNTQHFKDYFVRFAKRHRQNRHGNNNTFIFLVKHNIRKIMNDKNSRYMGKCRRLKYD